MNLVIIFIIGSIFSSVSGEIFSASADLATTFQLEKQVVNVLAELVAKAEAKLSVIRRCVLIYSIIFDYWLISCPIVSVCRYLDDYESVIDEQASSEEEFLEKVAGNPIHAYLLMKRLTLHWENIEHEFKNDDWKGIA